MSLFPENVKFLSTERFMEGGSSSGNLANFNLARHVNDSEINVSANRFLLKNYYL